MTKAAPWPDGFRGPTAGEFGYAMVPLTLDRVPDPNSEPAQLWEFALEYDGYEAFGGPDELAQIANRVGDEWNATGDLPDDLATLRACLFFEQRRWRHFGHDPQDRDLAYVDALVEKIRRVAAPVDANQLSELVSLLSEHNAQYLCPIENLKLPAATQAAFRGAGIHLVGQLVDADVEQLVAFLDLEASNVETVKGRLKELNLSRSHRISRFNPEKTNSGKFLAIHAAMYDVLGNDYYLARAYENMFMPRTFLAHGARSEDPQLRRAVADNPSTPEEVLASLALDTDHGVRYTVATNRSTDPEVLSALLKDQAATVRSAAAMNPFTPVEALTRLIEDRTLHLELAANPALDSDLRAELVRDLIVGGDERAASLAVRLPTIRPDAQVLIARHPSARLRKALAERDDLVLDAAEILADDPDAYIRTRVARLRPLSRSTLERLADDANGAVREAATRRLEEGDHSPK